jgi:aspartyl-tRNA(Asn)/glutamyl-tRNA(Gln) amidotransferase subunit C
VQLSAVLEHASALQSRDLSNVPPTTHALAMRNVLRKDVVQESLDREEVLDVAPSKEGGRFKVPSILGDAP